MAVCVIDGNTDMYGIGIRIGFYLQWYGAIFASWLAPSEVETLRFTITVFIAATFVALIAQVARDVDGLDVVEVYIILLLTFGYFLFLVPLYTWRLLTRCNPRFDPTRYPRVHSGPVYSQLNFLLLVAVASFQLWFWFARVAALNQRNCQEYGFFFAKIRLDAKAFVTVNIVFHMLLLILCIIILLISLGKRTEVVEEVEWSQPPYCFDPEGFSCSSLILPQKRPYRRSTEIAIRIQRRGCKHSPCSNRIDHQMEQDQRHQHPLLSRPNYPILDRRRCPRTRPLCLPLPLWTLTPSRLSLPSEPRSSFRHGHGRACSGSTTAAA